MVIMACPQHGRRVGSIFNSVRFISWSHSLTGCAQHASNSQYVNTRLDMVDSSQSPEIISLTSGVQ